MKKILALLFCAAMILGLCACGKNAEESAETSVRTEETGSSGAATTEETAVPSEAEETTPAAESSAPTEEPSEAEPHIHVNYKGLSHIYTLEEMEAAEGRPCDFTAEAGGDTLYIYNDTTADSMTFHQVQHTFHEDYNRISCTYTSDTDTEAVMESYHEILNGIYGESSHQTGHGGADLWSWMDHTGNYVILTRINEETIQVAYYIYAE